MREGTELLFHSTEFAIFLAVVLAAYWPLVRWPRAQNALLLAASYVFYGFWDARFLLLLGFSTLVDYAIARAIEGSSSQARRRRLITLSVCLQLGILGFFKYAGFFVSSMATLLTTLGIEAHLPTLRIILPVGVSFFTFQSMSYTIDVYRGQLRAERSLLSFACFVALFPQLVAGPIERAKHLLPQITGRRRLGLTDVYAGAWLVFWGLYKKMFIADNVAIIVDAAFARSAELTRVEAALALYAFALQIYADFSGYTDIARGTARWLGFEFRLNFARPYLATNPSDFWQRWHISLSSWLRDYLYVPLGGNRGSSLATYRNLMLTMLLGGLWHGAAWTFVLWGAYHGALLVFHRMLQPWLARAPTLGNVPALFWRWSRTLGWFHLVVLGWLPFRAQSIGQVAEVLAALISRDGLGQGESWGFALLVFGSGLFLYECVEERWPDAGRRLPFWLRALGYALIALSILVAGAPSGQTFIYFQF